MASNVALQDSYNQIKEQYDTLLEKNQNDLIKIKQKQKNINDNIKAIQLQYQAKENHYQQQIAILQNNINQLTYQNALLTQAHSNVLTQVQSNTTEKPQAYNPNTIKSAVDIHSQENASNSGEIKIQQLEENVRTLIDKNIALTQQHTLIMVKNQQFQTDNEALRIENEALKTNCQTLRIENEALRTKDKNQVERILELERINGQIKSINQETNISKESSTNTEGSFISKKMYDEVVQQLNTVKNEVFQEKIQTDKLEDTLKYINSDLKRTIEKEKKLQILLRKKETQIITYLEEIDKIRQSGRIKRKTQGNQPKECLKCVDLKQQIELLKEMVRSTQTMVRVKQIENQRFKIHYEEPHLKNSSSSSAHKVSQKFPPIQKKKYH